MEEACLTGTDGGMGRFERCIWWVTYAGSIEFGRAERFERLGRFARSETFGRGEATYSAYSPCLRACVPACPMVVLPVFPSLLSKNINVLPNQPQQPNQLWVQKWLCNIKHSSSPSSHQIQSSKMFTFLCACLDPAAWCGVVWCRLRWYGLPGCIASA